MYKIFLVILLSIYSFAHSYRSDDTNNIQTINKSLNFTYDETNSFQKILPKTIGGEYNTILTEHFRIYYGNTNPGSTLWNDVDKNGVADYLDLLKVELEYIWDIEVEKLGFKSPNYGDYIDVFISDTGLVLDGSSLNMGDNVVGWSVYDENNGETYMVVNGGIGYYNGTSGKDLLRITLAHEFFHLVQYAYAHDNADFYDKNLWLYEGTAVWMEYQVYPQIDDYINAYGEYISSVLTKGIVEEGGIYPYSTNYFFDYINNNSNLNNLIKNIWEKFEQNSDSIKAIDEALALDGKSLYNELVNYASDLNAKDTTKYTNGKVLFDTLDTSFVTGEFYCNSTKTKYMGYYSVMLFDDSNVYDDCNIMQINSNLKTINISDGDSTLAGDLFNIKKSAKAAVLIPNSTITTNSTMSVSFKMIEQEKNELKSGWNLLGSVNDIDILSLSGIDDINTIWSYSQDGGWYLYSKSVDNYGLEKLNSLKSGEGFWINTKTVLENPFVGSFDKSKVCDFDNLVDGWNLVANRCVTSLDLDSVMNKYGIKHTWSYDGSTWLLRQKDPVEDYGFGTFTDIKSNIGYWFYK